MSRSRVATTAGGMASFTELYYQLVSHTEKNYCLHSLIKEEIADTIILVPDSLCKTVLYSTDIPVQPVR